jgi:hypothetical protein
MGHDSFLQAFGRRARAGGSGWSYLGAELVLWLLPLALALSGHLFGWTKADLPVGGPGLHIGNLNDGTLRAQQAWHFLNTNWPLFVAYGVVLLVTFGLLKRRGVRWPVRLAVFAVLAIPGLWYCSLSSYLGAKLLGM